MVQGRAIRCDCGAVMEARQTRFEGFETEATVCPKCNFVTLTREQAERYARLRQLHQIIDSERKVIRVGNSMGFTLPDSLKGFGIRIGKKVRTEALGLNSFKVEFS